MRPKANGSPCLPKTPSRYTIRIYPLFSTRLNGKGLGEGMRVKSHGTARPLWSSAICGTGGAALLTRRVIRIENANSFFAAHPLERYSQCIFDNVASLIRRDVWEKIPFPEAPFGEDLEWAYRVLVNGGSIVYEPEARVEHSHQRSAEYVYKRTFVDHYRLYELFGVRTVPTIPKKLRSFFITTFKDWAYLSHTRQRSGQRLRDMINAPRFAWASAKGQYDGARAAACGYPIFQSRDV